MKINYNSFKNFNNVTHEQHPYHLVSSSPLPSMVAFNLFSLVFFFVSWFSYNFSIVYMNWCLFWLFLILMKWFSDIVTESSFEGFHTSRVRRGLKFGMILFIVSEICFFFSFFWAYFYLCLDPSIEISFIWPYKGIEAIDPFSLPLFNTIVLLSSGVTVTYAHKAIVKGYKNECTLALFYTIALGVIFTLSQGFEYQYVSFNLNDGAYGSCFYILTGFHGLHVIVGTIFLFICFIRNIKDQFLSNHHIGFECAAWYWHFVDIVWLFLFVFIYCWGGGWFTEISCESKGLNLPF